MRCIKPPNRSREGSINYAQIVSIFDYSEVTMLGACGEDDTGRDMTANIVAMSSEVMGFRSNDNPLCGRMIAIYNPSNGKVSTGMPSRHPAGDLRLD
ncbi:hypothetical protein F5883DRAFT_580936 [Diaporthe sp. PMI_573]|nr:hypothetical protein F5883DRAFT_580936 [Diaporthaceae sp. PMI_573]